MNIETKIQNNPYVAVFASEKVMAVGSGNGNSVLTLSSFFDKG